MSLSEEQKKMYLYVFADCQIVVGHKRSMVCDLTGKRMHFIPSQFAYLFAKFRTQEIGLIFEEIKDDTIEVLK